MPLLFFHSPSNPLLSFFFNNQNVVICGSASCKQCAKGEGWRVLWNGQKAGGLSLRVKRDERVGVWWLDGVDVSVMAWCQTLCHCQWSATSTHPSMVSHSPVCFKAIVLLPLQSVFWCCCVVPLFCPFVQFPSLLQLSCLCCLHHELCLCLGSLVCVV